MASHDDVRRIISKLPGAVESPDEFGFWVPVKGKAKGFVWLWKERIEPKRSKVPNPDVLAIVVPNLNAKEFILSSQVPGCFTEPHYNGFPAVLVRLSEVRDEDLQDLLIEGWRCKATKDLLDQFDPD